MVCMSVVKTVVLLSLSLSLWTEGIESQNWKETELPKIINFLKKFKPSNAGDQYAIAVDFPEQICNNPVDETQLSNIIKDEVKLNNNKLYVGQRMIVVLPYKNAHCENRLLNVPNNGQSLLQELYYKNPNEGHCLIFFTHYSPCLQTCLNTANNYRILNKIEQFRLWPANHAVLVFQEIFDNRFNSVEDQKQNLHQGFQNLTTIDVYRCDNPTQCRNCKGVINENNNLCLDKLPNITT